MKKGWFLSSMLHPNSRGPIAVRDRDYEIIDIYPYLQKGYHIEISESLTSSIMSTKGWQELCAERKQKQNAQIPAEWVVTPPSDSRGSVLDFPEKCGLLSDIELKITNATVDTLLGKLAIGHWSSVQVTTAFYKRAIIAHQLVRIS